MTQYFPPAPALDIVEWLNTPAPITLESLRGKVVVLHAFQMLCPACVSHGLPQARAIRAAFPVDEVAVLGLHTVFEHHDVMTPDALRAFAQEYRLGFPIGIDRPAHQGSIPHTMREWQLQGTPSLMLVDHAGRLRMSRLGHVEDLVIGAAIGRLLAEREQGNDAVPPDDAARDG